MVKKFMIPVGVAVAALFPITSNAKLSTQPVEAGGEDKQAAPQSGITTQVMQYLKGDERHELLMKKSETGILFAQHSSHASHASHGSHRSSR